MSSTPAIVDAAHAESESVVWLDAAEDASRRRLLAQRRERHWTMLLISVLVIVASAALELRPSGKVGASWLRIASLPPMCGSRALFGIECPGCGLTRSFVALGSGDFQESFRLHRVGWLLAAAVVLQIPYRVFALRELRTRVPQRTWPDWFGYGLIAALVLNWLAKISGLG
jgi:hypothetical protein